MPAGFLRDEIPGEPVGRLNNDHADAVARDVLQHGGEARAPSFQTIREDR